MRAREGVVCVAGRRGNETTNRVFVAVARLFRFSFFVHLYCSETKVVGLNKAISDFLLVLSGVEVARIDCRVRALSSGPFTCPSFFCFC